MRMQRLPRLLLPRLEEARQVRLHRPLWLWQLPRVPQATLLQLLQLPPLLPQRCCLLGPPLLVRHPSEERQQLPLRRRPRRRLLLPRRRRRQRKVCRIARCFRQAGNCYHGSA